MKTTIYTLAASDGTYLGKTDTSSYPNVLNFDSHAHTVSNPKDLYNLIQETAAQGHCLVKGELSRNLVCESRAGSTDRELPTSWICLDLDGVDLKTPEDFLHTLPTPFHTCSYVLQYSSSHGSKPGLRCHIFMMLREPTFPSVLKQALQHYNFTIKSLTNSLELTGSRVALRYPLDVTTCQNDKILYVAPKLGAKQAKKLISYVEKARQTIKIDFSDVTPEQNKANNKTEINRLRKAMGLDPRKQINITTHGTIEIMSKPGEAMISGMKEDRGFVYLNLNGGDSWAYYHPVGNVDIIYNFKGEPFYKTHELLPAYYAQQKKALAGGKEEELDVQNTKVLAFLDPRTDSYYRGLYNKATQKLELFRTNSHTKVQHFLKQHHQPVPEFIPEWTLVYDFDSGLLVDEENHMVNMYRPSIYMVDKKPSPVVTTVPPTINRVISHVLGNDEEAKEHFLNWLAYITQTRKMATTAWVLHGTQGTGKGVLFNRILTPLMGADYAFKTTLPTFEKEFNSFMENSLIILVDEAQISALGNKSVAMENIKTYITDSPVTIRRMRTDQYQRNNHASFILASNKNDPIEIDPEDRRFNVAPRQEQKILEVISREEIDQIDDELMDFANYLFNREADRSKAGTPLMSEERRRLQELTRDSSESVADAIKSGNLAFFIDNAPDSEDVATFSLNSGIANPPRYDAIVNEMIENRRQTMNLPRDYLEVLFYYVVGTSFKTRHKFTKFCGHKGLYIEAVGCKGKTTRGYHGALFLCDDAALQRWVDHCSDDEPTKGNVRRIK